MLPVDAPVFAVERYFISEERKARFEEVLIEVKHYFKLAGGGEDLVSGRWRIRRDRER